MNNTKEPQRIGVAVIVLDETGAKCLLGERLNTAHGAGNYGMPGGRVEDGELLEETCKRELLEEVGLVSKELKYVGVAREWNGTYNFIHFIYVCTQYTGEVQNLEPDKCGGWEWYDLDNLPNPTSIWSVMGIEMFRNKDNENIRDILGE